MIKKLIITLFFVALLYFGYAQISFGSSTIKDLYNRLPEVNKNVIMEMGKTNPFVQVDSLIDYNGISLSVSFNDGILNKLGIHLKGIQPFTKNDSIVISFLERALFRLSFEKTIPDMMSTAETMQLNILIQNESLLFSSINSIDELLRCIESITQFTLSHNDYLFIAEWKRNDTSLLRMIFPNNYQLMVGKNKKELDEFFFGNLLELKSNEILLNNNTSKVGKVNANDSSSIFVSDRQSYMNLFSNETYYYLDNGDSLFVFSEDYIQFSVANLFMRYELCEERKLDIVQKMYGDRSYSIKLPMGSLINYLVKNEFESYFAIESSTIELINGTILFAHKYFNYVHMLYFQSNSTELFNADGTINATLHTNIPMHNVSNLFGAYIEDDKFQKTDILISSKHE